MTYHTMILLVILLSSCGAATEYRTIGSIERIDPAIDDIIRAGAEIEVLSEGYIWSEGPVWIPEEEMLLFSDVPANTIYRWKDGAGATTFLSPSGYTGDVPSKSHEPGSNGLLLDGKGRLVLCQHGDRRIARMDASFDSPEPVFVTLADSYRGKRFNSPNDAVFGTNGDLYFTDPPYGLPDRENDLTRELPFHGVYRLTADGHVTLLVDSISRPNGIALTPDERTLIVANSDPAKPVWYAFDFDERGSLINARLFFDPGKAEGPGLPDGLKIDKQGYVFASGPGGIWIFAPDGKNIGKIRLPEATANCALGDNDKTLYITSRQYLLRVRMR